MINYNININYNIFSEKTQLLKCSLWSIVELQYMYVQQADLQLPYYITWHYYVYISLYPSVRVTAMSKPRSGASQLSYWREARGPTARVDKVDAAISNDNKIIRVHKRPADCIYPWNSASVSDCPGLQYVELTRTVALHRYNTASAHCCPCWRSTVACTYCILYSSATYVRRFSIFKGDNIISLDSGETRECKFGHRIRARDSHHRWAPEQWRKKTDRSIWL